MSPAQKATIKFWGKPYEGLVTCTDFDAFKHDTVVCLERFIFTTAISIIHGNYRVTRFCYHTKPEAKHALEDWKKKKYEGKPENYITQKPEMEIPT